MLVYTGMAADIAEIFEAFRESKVEIHRILNIRGLFVCQLVDQFVDQNVHLNMT